MLNDKRQGTAEGRSCRSDRESEGSCKTLLHADSNKAARFNYMNLQARQITDNRVQRRTGRLRGERFTFLLDLEAVGELRVGGRIHLSLQPSGPIQSRIMMRSNIFGHVLSPSIS